MKVKNLQRQEWKFLLKVLSRWNSYIQMVVMENEPAAVETSIKIPSTKAKHAQIQWPCNPCIGVYLTEMKTCVHQVMTSSGTFMRAVWNLEWPNKLWHIHIKRCHRVNVHGGTTATHGIMGKFHKRNAEQTKSHKWLDTL